ncbi:hypothetical protein WP5S18E01_11530 [Enterobacter cloacae]|nr:hypothetical protein WP5S18E01_11530 [Enterobacter cloacae]
MESDEWGNILREDNPHNLQQLIRLPGQQWDKETGLYYNRHRYLDPLQGRYITQDPIGLKGGLNPYTYPLNPTTDADPLGLFVMLLPIIGEVAINWLVVGSGVAGGAVLATPSDAPQSKAKTESLTKCDTAKLCPPCKTISGRIIPVKTLSYRPLDEIPDDKMEHGVYGSHHNIFEANQAPSNTPKPALLNK